MRKAVAIGLSGLVIYSYSGVGHSSLKPLASAVSHQYTHLIDNNQSLPLNRLSQSVLIAERTVSLSKFTQIASVTFITGGSGWILAMLNLKMHLFRPVKNADIT